MAMDDQTEGPSRQEIPGGKQGNSSGGGTESGRRTFRRGRYIAAGLVLFLVAGVLLWRAHEGSRAFSWDALLGRPVAAINGDAVPRKEFRERLAVSRVVLERQYGKNLFTGERGRDLLANLERDVLERMLEERLVAQEARRLNVGVSDEKVRQTLQGIATDIYGGWEAFQASLREDGISSEYLSEHIRKRMLRQEVERAKAPPGANPDGFPGVWLVQARRDARITVYEEMGQPQASFQGGGSCCGASGGGCGGSERSAGPVEANVAEKASRTALAAYRKSHAPDTGIKAKVNDYGCHIQVDIEQGDRIVKSYTYRDGEVSEL
jgi:hypothetical protein